MALNIQWGLGSPTLPLKAEGPDVMGAELTGVKMREAQMGLAEKQRLEQETSSDRAILSDYLKGGGDLFTPTGLEKSLGALRGKVSPNLYMQLGQNLAKVKQADVQYRAGLAKANEADLTGQLDLVNAVGPAIQKLMAQYDEDVKSVGEQAATEKFLQTRNTLLDQAGGMFSASPYGKQARSLLETMTPESAPMFQRLSGYHAQSIKETLEQTRARQAAAQAALLEGRAPPGTENLMTPEGRVVANIPGMGLMDTATGQPYTGRVGDLKPMPTARGAGAAAGRWEMFQDPVSKNTFRQNAQTGETQVQDPTTGEFKPAPGGLPPGVVKPGTAQAVKAMSEDAFTKEPPLTQEENAKLTEYARIYGRPISAPQYGTGAAASNLRTGYYRAFVNDMKARGETPTAAAIQASLARASQESLKRLTIFDSVLRSEEGEALKLLDKVQGELEKLGGVASPYLRNKWNTIETQLLGNPDFVSLNTYMKTFVDTLARLTSNAQGSGATPVAYLRFAEAFANKDFNLEQLKTFKPAFEGLVDARRKGVEAALKDLTDRMKPPPRKEGGAVAPEIKPADILRQEYDKAVTDLSGLTGDARRRKLDDVRSLRSELKRAGVEVPDVTEAPAPAAAPAPAKALTAAEVREVRRAWGDYEPNKYDYRLIDGQWRRRPKETK